MNTKVNIDEKLFTLLPQNKKDFVYALKNTEFTPSLSFMAKGLNKSVSSVFDTWKWIQDKFNIKVEVTFTPKKDK